jgi:hypothetical protein
MFGSVLSAPPVAVAATQQAVRHSAGEYIH